FRVSFVFGDENDRSVLPGLEVLEDADILLLSVRRRVLPAGQLEAFRNYVAAGKPLIGIRTASHAFCLRNKTAPEGLTDWPEFDAQVFGGNYTNHYGNALECTVHIEASQSGHPILSGIEAESFRAGGSLYRTAPLREGATVL